MNEKDKKTIADGYGLVPSPIGYSPRHGDFVLCEGLNGAWRKIAVTDNDEETFTIKPNRFEVHIEVSMAHGVFEVLNGRQGFVAISPSTLSLFEEGAANWSVFRDQVDFIMGKVPSSNKALYERAEKMADWFKAASLKLEET